MELKASEQAQFFVQREYYQVSIEEHYLIIASSSREERIPFSVWNGEVDVERGLLWGSLTFGSHEKQGETLSWKVQGLPWKLCRSFAHKAVETYRAWHLEQCKQLKERLPHWKNDLSLLKKQPAYLADSSVHRWRDTIYEQLKSIDVSYDEAMQRMPQSMADIDLWISDIEHQVDERNEAWLQNERLNWEVLFSQIESSPLNISQQHAVLLNNDNNLILAGAGSGKTSVLITRIAYLLQSHLAQAEAMLMLAFGKEAVSEIEQRLQDRIGSGANAVMVNTFHQLGLYIINKVEGQNAKVTQYATDDKLKRQWCSDWLRQHWQSPVDYKRWQKHLSAWPIAYLVGDDELIKQAENPKLIAWLEGQLDQLCSLHLTRKQIQQRLIEHLEYPRLNSELALVWPCYLAWQQMLKEKGEIDFYTMITRATDYVSKGKFTSPWRYIMVDEYQDISPDRLQLIEALCLDNKQKRCASLFAVGDDWQSIYQFAGSNVDLTTEFAQRFDSASIHYLDTSYRFHSMIGEVANQFIQKNPHQLEKELKSFRLQKQKAVVICPMARVENELDELNRKTKQQKSVLLLGRYHYHKPEHLADWKQAFRQLKLEFMTCHASKGKEADYVFILNVDEGQFPPSVRPKHLSAVLSESRDPFPFAEERRLFYVALTRAKERVWITHGAHSSPFINELLTEEYAVVKQR